MKEKYLPIGTVVMLKGGKKRVMICGYCMTEEKNPDIIYDYNGCMFPEGIISSNQALLFNHDQIENIYFEGLSDDEEKDFIEKLKITVNNSISNTNEPKDSNSNIKISDDVAEILNM